MSQPKYDKLFKFEASEVINKDLSEYCKKMNTLTWTKLRNYLNVLERKSVRILENLVVEDLPKCKVMGTIYSTIFKNRPANYMSFVSIEVIKQIVIYPELFTKDNSIDLMGDTDILNYLNKRICAPPSNLIASKKDS